MLSVGPLLRQAYLIAVGRIRSGWRLEMVLFLGILLAVALMSSGVIYSQFLEETTLQKSLAAAKPSETNLSIQVSNPLNPSTYQDTRGFVEGRVGNGLSPFIQEEARLLETRTFFFEGHPQLLGDGAPRPRGKVQYISGLEERADLLQGRWPRGMGNPLEVAVDRLGGELLGLSVGDNMLLSLPGSSIGSPTPTVRIVGTFQRRDPSDEYWYDLQRAFSYREEGRILVPLFTTEEVLFRGLGAADPGMAPYAKWYFYLDRKNTSPSDVKPLSATLDWIRASTATEVEQSSISTGLGRILDDYSQQILLARIPLFLLVFLATGILMYYLALVATVVVRNRAREIAVLKSRGSSTFQLGLMSLVESLLLAVPAMVLGPLLAMAVVEGVARVFFEAGAGSPSAASAMTPAAFALGAAGGLMAVVVFTLVTTLAARRSIVEFAQASARPPQTPMIHRYYLDLVALALIGLLWWQMESRGAFLVRPLGQGNLEIDYSLLLAPALGLLAIGLLVLRLFPIFIGLLAWVSEQGGPLWLVQGLRRLSRDPVMPGILVVLIMVACALSVTASALNSSVERSQRDRALYEAGADLRIKHQPVDKSVVQPNTAALSAAGVAQATQVRRISGSLLTTGQSAAISAVAVDSLTFADVAWFRPDFASQDLPDLTRRLNPRDTAPHGIAVPPGATALALWVRPVTPHTQSTVRARLEDSKGLFFNVDLGSLDSQDWQRLEAPLEPVREHRGGLTRTVPEVQPPFTLSSLIFDFGPRALETNAVFLDRLTAITGQGEHLLGDFQSLETWHAIEDFSSPSAFTLESSESVSREGRRGAIYVASPAGAGVRGVRAGPVQSPLPAVVSSSFLEAANSQPGDIINIRLANIVVPVQVVGKANFFPTLDPGETPFAILGLEALDGYLEVHQSAGTSGPNELWVRLDDPSQDPAEIIAALYSAGITVGEVHHGQNLVNDRLSHPLITTGWDGLLTLLYLAVVITGASGVILFAYMDIRQRQTEFAISRTLGFTPAQLRGVVWFNILAVVVCGVGLGTWLGQLMSASLLPILEVAEAGVRVTPPMVLESGWLTVLAPYLTLAVLIGISAPWLAWLAYRVEVQSVLRMGSI